MAEKQETTMVIKVDLACEKCRKKIKKVLCNIPQIQNQVYNEKGNEVIITVVCCSPEKVKKKIYCKGGKTVKGIEILKPPPPPPPPKPKEPEKPKEAPPPPPPKPKEPEKPKEAPPPPKPKEPEKPKEAPPPPKPKEPEKPKEAPPPKPKEPEKPKEAPPPKPKEPEKRKPPPVAPAPVPPQPPVPTCCRECYEGYGGGPCWEGYGGRGPCWGGYGGPSGPCYGKPVYDSWGGGYWRPIYPSRCTDYICEENPNAACSIM